jgi:hypothetical protein
MNLTSRGFIAPFLLIATLFLSPIRAQAQDIGTMIKSHRYSFSYFGNNAIRPGLSVRSEITFKQWEKTRRSRRYLVGKKIDRIHQKQYMFTKNAALYVHPGSQVSFIRNWGLGIRKTRNKGWEYQFDLYPLGFQFFVLGETYKVSNTGDVTKKNMSISAYYTPGISASFGKKFKKERSSLEAWHVRLGINGLSNYNNTWVPTANLELGVRIKSKKSKKGIPTDAKK